MNTYNLKILKFWCNEYWGISEYLCIKISKTFIYVKKLLNFVKFNLTYLGVPCSQKNLVHYFFTCQSMLEICLNIYLAICKKNIYIFLNMAGNLINMSLIWALLHLIFLFMCKIYFFTYILTNNYKSSSEPRVYLWTLF